MVEISTSILTVEKEKATRTFYDLEVAGTDYYHIDIMDGKFVEKNTEELMYEYASTIKQISNLPLDVHLMVEDIKPHIEKYIPLEPSIITFHYEACKNKEAAYEVLKYLYEDETIQVYLDDQGGIACKEGDFAIPETLEDMRPYIEDNRMADYQDHHYPSEMSVDAMIQTFLLDESDNAQEKFLKKFDSDWKRYNRDLIRKVQDYQKEQEDAQ